MDPKQEILRRLDSLPVDLQNKLLEFMSGNRTAPAGAGGEHCAAFAGTLDSASAQEMIDAIEAECERIDAGW